MRKFSGKYSRGSKYTHFKFSNFFFPPESHAAYEIMWKKYGGVGRATDGKSYDTGKTRFACRITKTEILTHAHNI
jgi:hypothetical protein